MYSRESTEKTTNVEDLWKPNCKTLLQDKKKLWTNGKAQCVGEEGLVSKGFKFSKADLQF